MKRVLVTGAAGFVGANLVRRLLKRGDEVHVFLKPGVLGWRLADVEGDIRTHELSICNREKVSHAVRNIKPEWIFHAAVYGAYSSQTEIDQMIATNIEGTVNLVEECAATGFETFVNTGSSSEYGFKSHAPKEEDALEANSHYSWTKAAASAYCRYTARSSGLRIPTLRLYSVYGPFEEPSRLIPRLIEFGLRGEFPPLVDPFVARDFVFVEDVVDAYLAVSESPLSDLGAIYNVGSGNQTTIGEAVQTAKRVMNIPGEPQWSSMKNRTWDTNTWIADAGKIERELGWKAQASFEVGLCATIEVARVKAAEEFEPRV